MISVHNKSVLFPIHLSRSLARKQAICQREASSEKQSWIDVRISLLAVPKRQPRGHSLQP